MQTFLPYPDFAESAKVLDYQRLGKQRIEALQILRINLGIVGWKGWLNHPAVRMWKGYEDALSLYGLTMCYEWLNRGFEDNTRLKFIEYGRTLDIIDGKVTMLMPPWMGEPAFHRSHRLKLLWKNPVHYASYFQLRVPHEEPAYVWPV